MTDSKPTATRDGGIGFGAAVWRRIALPLYRTVALLVQHAPAGLAYWSADRLADFVFTVVWQRRRRVVLANMRHVLGRQASSSRVRSTARHSVRNYARYMVEFLCFPRLSHDEILATIGIDCWDRFDALLAEGRGVIFVGLHMGNWDLAGAAAGIRGYPFRVVADVIQPPALNDVIQGVRQRQGMHILPMENAARGLLKALKAGELVGLLIDRPSPDDGVPVRFFDRTAYVPAGAATLALRTNARVIPAAVIRRPDQRFNLVLDERFRYDPIGDREADVRELTQAIMTSLEDMVRSTPDQWYMFRPMWPAATATSGYRQPQRAALGVDA